MIDLPKFASLMGAGMPVGRRRWLLPRRRTLGRADDVVRMAFKAFGRRVAEHTGLGTDHATAENRTPLLLIQNFHKPAQVFIFKCYLFDGSFEECRLSS